MKGTLTKKSTFKDLENWFDANLDILPNTLNGECKYYFDLKATIKIYIKQVYSEVENNGIEYVKNKKSMLANSAKNNLFTIYEDLQNRENWNVPRAALSPFNNKNE